MKKILLTPSDLMHLHERAVHLYNYEYDTVAQAWIEAVNELLSQNDTQIMFDVQAKNTYTGSVDEF